MDGFLSFLSFFMWNEFSDGITVDRLVSTVVSTFQYHIWTKLVDACIAGLTREILVRA